MNKNLFFVAKEGWKYIAYTFLALIIFMILDLETLSILAFLILLFFVFSFRNPERELPNFEPKSVLSPIDGRVISVDAIKDNSQFSYKVTLESDYLDVSILRSPMSATVHSCIKTHGAKLSIDTELSKKLNENVTITFEDTHKNTLQISHIVKQSFCGIQLDNLKNKNLVQSARYGVMISGLSYIYLPQNFKLHIKASDKLEASQSLIGYFS